MLLKNYIHLLTASLSISQSIKKIKESFRSGGKITNSVIQTQIVQLTELTQADTAITKKKTVQCITLQDCFYCSST